MHDDEGDRSRYAVPDQPQDVPPLPNRFDGGTALGCLGIVCVLALPAILFLPVEDWHLPTWALRLVPLLALGIALVGVWLLARMPPARLPRSSDPRYPLTEAGRAPVVEQPAG
ncbi:MAG: hypothetical protein ACHQ4H_09975, partial [Ktedonobacterales bacterium]